jgi:serine/threonine protein kinase
MGYEQSRLQAEVLEGVASAPSPVPTTVIVHTQQGKITCSLSLQIHTIRDLLLHLNRLRPIHSPVLLSLASLCCSEVLDTLLLNPSQSCDILRDGEELVAIEKGKQHVETVSGPVDMSHFHLVKVIGKGAMATVYEGENYLARKKDTGWLYALKVLNKRIILKEDKVNHVFSEKTVLLRCCNPFILRLHHIFHTVSSTLVLSPRIRIGPVSRRRPIQSNATHRTIYRRTS